VRFWESGFTVPDCRFRIVVLRMRLLGDDATFWGLGISGIQVRLARDEATPLFMDYGNRNWVLQE
jgi:hypothetical protein